MADFDLAVVGGGINGTGIARDAAGRGLKVLLVEQNDLASGTSSASTKLIHGGLRYLEHGAFHLVREALAEREVLLRSAPHLVRPMRFVLPVEEKLRNAWLIRLGLFLYDHIGGRSSLPRTRKLDLGVEPVGAPLQRRYTAGFEYSDCVVDDSRLVVLNTVDAAERGATIRTRTRCMRAERADRWTLVLNARGRRDVVTARVLVNATGPWTLQFADAVAGRSPKVRVRLVKGSHIVVRSLFDHGSAYIFQNVDRRIVFAIPFGADFTLIGTTDEDFAGDLEGLAADRDEIAYLCDAVTRYFRNAISPADVIWTFAGVRSLHGDGSRKAQDLARDYVLDLDVEAKGAPLLNIYGGKITTYRHLAEAAMTKLAGHVAARPAWTATARLPGGDLDVPAAQFADQVRREWRFLSERHAQRLAAAYGNRVKDILRGATSLDDLGPRFGEDLTGAEVRYLMRREWAETADDVLWRRSKLGLRITSAEKAALEAFMASTTGAPEHVSAVRLQ